MYSTKATIADILILHIKQLANICKQAVNIFEDVLPTLPDLLRNLTPEQICDASAVAFRSIWCSTLPTGTKTFYTEELNAMHKCIITRKFEHTYISNGETKVHNDFTVNAISTMLINMVNDTVALHGDLNHYIEEVTTDYTKGTEYWPMFNKLGVRFGTVMDFLPTKLYVDVLTAYISDEMFIAAVDKLTYHSNQLANLLCQICNLNYFQLYNIAHTIYLSLPLDEENNKNDIIEFDLTNYIINYKGDNIIKYPTYEQLFEHLMEEEDDYKGEEQHRHTFGNVEMYVSHQHIHYMDDEECATLNDPLDYLYQYGNEEEDNENDLYYPSMDVCLAFEGSTYDNTLASEYITLPDKIEVPNRSVNTVIHDYAIYRRPNIRVATML